MPMALHENPKGDENIKMTIVQKFGSQIVKELSVLSKPPNFSCTAEHMAIRNFLDLRRWWIRI